jgi:hypothetical protein
VGKQPKRGDQSSNRQTRPTVAGPPRAHEVFWVDEGGTKHRLETTRLIVEVGNHTIEVDLTIQGSPWEHKFAVRVLPKAEFELLVVGPGDAGQVLLGGFFPGDEAKKGVL